MTIRACVFDAYGTLFDVAAAARLAAAEPGQPMDRLPARPGYQLPDLSGIPDLAARL